MYLWSRLIALHKKVPGAIRTCHVFQRVCWHVHSLRTGNRLLPNDGRNLNI